MESKVTMANSAAMRAVFELDLESVKRRLMNAEDGPGWSRERADRCEIEYKRFLTMAALCRGAYLVPSVDVDRFWHMHILDTRKYAADCQRALGFFLHHEPDTSARTAEDAARQQAAFARSRALYEALFGAGEEEQAAWCGMAAGEKAAWCGLTTAGATAAWCGIAAPGRAAAAAAA